MTGTATAGGRGDPNGASEPSPDATLVRLDDAQLEALRDVGREWGPACVEPEEWRRALPVDPDLVAPARLIAIGDRLAGREREDTRPAACRVPGRVDSRGRESAQAPGGHPGAGRL